MYLCEMMKYLKNLVNLKRIITNLIAKTKLNEVYLKKEIGKILEMDLAKLHVIIKRW